MLVRNTFVFSMKRKYTKNIFIHINIGTLCAASSVFCGLCRQFKNRIRVFFYVLLTMHLDIIMSRKTNFMHRLFLVYFVNLYMFRAYLVLSSGGTTVRIQQLVLIILFI